MRTQEDKKKIEYLSQYVYIKRAISRKTQELEELRAMAERVTPILSDTPSGIPDPHSRESAMAKLADMQLDIKADIEQLEVQKELIFKVIEEVKNPRHKEILECRYICGMTFEEILRKMDKESWSSLHKLHNRAIKLLKI